MILLIHNKEQVVEIVDLDNDNSIEISNINPTAMLFFLAEKFEDSILIWCHKSQKNNINIKGLLESFHLKNMMLSFTGGNQYLSEQIGYVEDSPFLKVNKKVKYPTWLMSSQVGAIHTSQLIKFKDIISTKNSFDYALNSFAKLGMVKGLFCYSDPNILKDSSIKNESKKASTSILFKFVKQHYKVRWMFLLFINYIWHDKRIPLLSAIKGFLYKRLKGEFYFDIQPFQHMRKEVDSSIDVLIPTLGRKKYLYDVLKDLANQTLLPKQIIIVEQNPDKSSKSELGFIKDETWPFSIIHKFIHQTGACNARNLALQHISSNYVFFADDDIRFSGNALSDVINFMNNNDIAVSTLSCLKPTDIAVFNRTIQWSSFGSGCSIVKKNVLGNTEFNMAFENGFGEDADFGMQLRNKGIDVVYYPYVKLIHLKAPIGGFRIKYLHPWETDIIQPKPSPTVMLNRLNNTSKHQLLGYKTVLFFKFYKHQELKNPFSYYKKFKKQWKQSVYWANKLKEDNS